MLQELIEDLELDYANVYVKHIPKTVMVQLAELLDQRVQQPGHIFLTELDRWLLKLLPLELLLGNEQVSYLYDESNQLKCRPAEVEELVANIYTAIDKEQPEEAERLLAQLPHYDTEHIILEWLIR